MKGIPLNHWFLCQLQGLRNSLKRLLLSLNLNRKGCDRVRKGFGFVRRDLTIRLRIG
jgi:hypothetical protein